MGFRITNGKISFPGLTIICNWNLLSDNFSLAQLGSRENWGFCGRHDSSFVNVWAFWIWEIKIGKVFRLKVHVIKLNGMKCRKCLLNGTWECRLWYVMWEKKQLRRIFCFYLGIMWILRGESDEASRKRTKQALF